MSPRALAARNLQRERHCEERSDEAIQSSTSALLDVQFWIASSG